MGKNKRGEEYSPGLLGRVLGDHQADFWASGNNEHGTVPEGFEPIYSHTLGIKAQPPAGMTLKQLHWRAEVLPICLTCPAQQFFL